VFITNQSITLFDIAATKPITLKLISFAEQRDRPAMTGISENITSNPTFSPEYKKILG
jgi:hypothetical protein